MIKSDSPKQLKVSLYNLMILIHNAVEAKTHPKIGDMEVDRTLDGLIQVLNKELVMPTELLESALFYSNMMSEEKKFWHPKRLSFQTLVKRMMRSDIEFDKNYNSIYYKKVPQEK